MSSEFDRPITETDLPDVNGDPANEGVTLYYCSAWEGTREYGQTVTYEKDGETYTAIYGITGFDDYDAASLALAASEDPDASSIEVLTKDVSHIYYAAEWANLPKYTVIDISTGGVWYGDYWAPGDPIPTKDSGFAVVGVNAFANYADAEVEIGVIGEDYTNPQVYSDNIFVSSAITEDSEGMWVAIDGTTRMIELNTNAFKTDKDDQAVASNDALDAAVTKANATGDVLYITGSTIMKRNGNDSTTSVLKGVKTIVGDGAYIECLGGGYAANTDASPDITVVSGGRVKTLRSLGGSNSKTSGTATVNVLGGRVSAIEGGYGSTLLAGAVLNINVDGGTVWDIYTSGATVKAGATVNVNVANDANNTAGIRIGNASYAGSNTFCGNYNITVTNSTIYGIAGNGGQAMGAFITGGGDFGQYVQNWTITLTGSTVTHSAGNNGKTSDSDGRSANNRTIVDSYTVTLADSFLLDDVNASGMALRVYDVTSVTLAGGTVTGTNGSTTEEIGDCVVTGGTMFTSGIYTRIYNGTVNGTVYEKINAQSCTTVDVEGGATKGDRSIVINGGSSYAKGVSDFDRLVVKEGATFSVGVGTLTNNVTAITIEKGATLSLVSGYTNNKDVVVSVGGLFQTAQSYAKGTGTFTVDATGFVYGGTDVLVVDASNDLSTLGSDAFTCVGNEDPLLGLKYINGDLYFGKLPAYVCSGWKGMTGAVIVPGGTAILGVTAFASKEEAAAKGFTDVIIADVYTAFGTWASKTTGTPVTFDLDGQQVTMPVSATTDKSQAYRAFTTPSVANSSLVDDFGGLNVMRVVDGALDMTGAGNKRYSWSYKNVWLTNSTISSTDSSSLTIFNANPADPTVKRKLTVGKGAYVSYIFTNGNVTSTFDTATVEAIDGGSIGTLYMAGYGNGVNGKLVFNVKNGGKIGTVKSAVASAAFNDDVAVDLADDAYISDFTLTGNQNGTVNLNGGHKLDVTMAGSTINSWVGSAGSKIFAKNDGATLNLIVKGGTSNRVSRINTFGENKLDTITIHADATLLLGSDYTNNAAVTIKVGGLFQSTGKYTQGTGSITVDASEFVSAGASVKVMDFSNALDPANMNITVTGAAEGFDVYLKDGDLYYGKVGYYSAGWKGKTGTVDVPGGTATLGKNAFATYEAMVAYNPTEAIFLDRYIIPGKSLGDEVTIEIPSGTFTVTVDNKTFFASNAIGNSGTGWSTAFTSYSGSEVVVYGGSFFGGRTARFNCMGRKTVFYNYTAVETSVAGDKPGPVIGVNESVMTNTTGEVIIGRGSNVSLVCVGRGGAYTDIDIIIRVRDDAFVQRLVGAGPTMTVSSSSGYTQDEKGELVWEGGHSKVLFDVAGGTVDLVSNGAYSENFTGDINLDVSGDAYITSVSGRNVGNANANFFIKMEGGTIGKIDAVSGFGTRYFEITAGGGTTSRIGAMNNLNTQSADIEVLDDSTLEVTGGINFNGSLTLGKSASFSCGNFTLAADKAVTLGNGASMTAANLSLTNGGSFALGTNATVTCNNLGFTNSTVTLASGAQISCPGAVTLTGTSLTLDATAKLTSGVFQNKEGSSFLAKTGAVTVFNSSFTNAGDYRFSVADGLTVAGSITNTGTITVDADGYSFAPGTFAVLVVNANNEITQSDLARYRLVNQEEGKTLFVKGGDVYYGEDKAIYFSDDWIKFAGNTGHPVLVGGGTHFMEIDAFFEYDKAKTAAGDTIPLRSPDNFFSYDWENQTGEQCVVYRGGTFWANISDADADIKLFNTMAAAQSAAQTTGSSLLIVGGTHQVSGGGGGRYVWDYKNTVVTNTYLYSAAAVNGAALNIGAAGSSNKYTVGEGAYLHSISAGSNGYAAAADLVIESSTIEVLDGGSIANIWWSNGAGGKLTGSVTVTLKGGKAGSIGATNGLGGTTDGDVSISITDNSYVGTLFIGTNVNAGWTLTAGHKLDIELAGSTIAQFGQRTQTVTKEAGATINLDVTGTAVIGIDGGTSGSERYSSGLVNVDSLSIKVDEAAGGLTVGGDTFGYTGTITVDVSDCDYSQNQYLVLTAPGNIDLTRFSVSGDIPEKGYSIVKYGNNYYYQAPTAYFSILWRGLTSGTVYLDGKPLTINEDAFGWYSDAAAKEGKIPGSADVYVNSDWTGEQEVVIDGYTVKFGVDAFNTFADGVKNAHTGGAIRIEGGDYVSEVCDFNSYALFIDKANVTSLIRSGNAAAGETAKVTITDSTVQDVMTATRSGEHPMASFMGNIDFKLDNSTARIVGLANRSADSRTNKAPNIGDIKFTVIDSEINGVGNNVGPQQNLYGSNVYTCADSFTVNLEGATVTSNGDDRTGYVCAGSITLSLTGGMASVDGADPVAVQGVLRVYGGNRTIDENGVVTYTGGTAFLNGNVVELETWDASGHIISTKSLVVTGGNTNRTTLKVTGNKVSSAVAVTDFEAINISVGATLKVEETLGSKAVITIDASAIAQAGGPTGKYVLLDTSYEWENSYSIINDDPTWGYELVRVGNKLTYQTTPAYFTALCEGLMPGDPVTIAGKDLVYGETVFETYGEADTVFGKTGLNILAGDTYVSNVYDETSTILIPDEYAPSGFYQATYGENAFNSLASGAKVACRQGGALIVNGGSAYSGISGLDGVKAVSMTGVEVENSVEIQNKSGMVSSGFDVYLAGSTVGNGFIALSGGTAVGNVNIGITTTTVNATKTSSGFYGVNGGTVDGDLSIIVTNSYLSRGLNAANNSSVTGDVSVTLNGGTIMRKGLKIENTAVDGVATVEAASGTAIVSSIDGFDAVHVKEGAGLTYGKPLEGTEWDPTWLKTLNALVNDGTFFYDAEVSDAKGHYQKVADIYVQGTNGVLSSHEDNRFIYANGGAYAARRQDLVFLDATAGDDLSTLQIGAGTYTVALDVFRNATDADNAEVTDTGTRYVFIGDGIGRNGNSIGFGGGAVSGNIAAKEGYGDSNIMVWGVQNRATSFVSIIGGTNAIAGGTIDSKSEVVVGGDAGATINGKAIVGASYLTNGAGSGTESWYFNDVTSNIVFEQGTLSHYLIGGALLNKDGVTATGTLSTNVTMKGGVVDSLIGGNYVQGRNTGTTDSQGRTLFESGTVTTNGTSNVLISGGTVVRNVYGGNAANGDSVFYKYNEESHEYEVKTESKWFGNTAITIDVTASKVHIGGNLIAGSSGGYVVGSSTVTFKGDGNNFSIGGAITGDSNHANDVVEGGDRYVSMRSLVFDEFKNNLSSSTLSGFDSVSLNDSQVSLDSKALLTTVRNWNFDDSSSLLDWTNGKNSFLGDTLVIDVEKTHTVGDTWTVFRGSDSILATWDTFSSVTIGDDVCGFDIEQGLYLGTYYSFSIGNDEATGQKKLFVTQVNAKLA